jgi:predicted acyl esterase
MPFKPGHTPLRWVPNLEQTFFNYYYRGAYDEFWQQESCDQERYFERHADVPGVYSGGWYDPFAGAVTGYFAAMAKKNTSPQRLIVGPWTHYTMRGAGESVSGDVDFGASALWGDVVYNRERLRWFDRWLKDEPNGVEDDPAVQIFVMGGGDGRKTPAGHLRHGGQWRAEREWPLARTRYTSYYLRQGGRLSADAPTADDPPARFAHDPSHPVPTIAGAVTGFFEMVRPAEGMNAAYITPRARMRSVVPLGGAHQQERPELVGARYPYPALAERSDVLVFQTHPLDREVEITGPIVVRLWISSSAVDTDFTAKLIDVYPANEDYADGYHLNLVDSIIRTRYRNGWDREELMTPGHVYRVEIALPPTSNLFGAGHRIRLDVSSSNFPRFDVNPNTGEPVGRHTQSIVAHNAVHIDRAHPSHVVLPMIPS